MCFKPVQKTENIREKRTFNKHHYALNLCIVKLLKTVKIGTRLYYKVKKKENLKSSEKNWTNIYTQDENLFYIIHISIQCSIQYNVIKVKLGRSKGRMMEGNVIVSSFNKSTNFTGKKFQIYLQTFFSYRYYSPKRTHSALTVDYYIKSYYSHGLKRTL